MGLALEGMERPCSTGSKVKPAVHGKGLNPGFEEKALLAKPIVASSPQPDLRGYVYLALMVLFGSTTSPFAKVAVSELPVGVLPLLRFGFAGLCLIPFLADRGALWRLLRDDCPPGWRLVAALCVPINQSFFLNAARLGPNSHVGLFYAVCPLVVWVLAWLLGHEKLDLRRLWGVLASIAGVAVIWPGQPLGWTRRLARRSSQRHARRFPPGRRRRSRGAPT